MDRRKFIQLFPALAYLARTLSSCNKKTVAKGSIIGASSSVGHMLREAKYGTPVQTSEAGVVIIGGGVSGLSAARWLDREGRKDFVLLELETQTGGNAASGKNEVSAYPWGAHYIPVPNNDLKQYTDFLEEANVIESWDQNGLPVYNEYHLCFDPQERLYINGKWQEGLIPDFGLEAKDKEQISEFLKQMDHFRMLKGTDGKDAFSIPVDNSSTDAGLIALDSMTMKDWMKGKDFTSEYLLWYVDYCCRDDFGSGIERTSAWAGIHYFASRKGKGANAEGHDVLTWPEGNGWLVEHLRKDIRDRIKTNCLAVNVSLEGDFVLIDYFDVKENKLKRIRAGQCIMAVPQFVAGRILHDRERIEEVSRRFHYVPWMVANLKVNALLERSGAPPCWDNVVYGSESLGYVVATHEQVEQPGQKKNITYYLPLTKKSPLEERKDAHQRTYEQWSDIILSDLKKVHPDIESSVEQLDVMVWGHAMAQPVPGFIHGNTRKLLSASMEDKIHFAHTDLAGISIFEEAFYQGLNAARKVLSKTSGT